MLSLQAQVDLGTMATKWYLAFPKGSALLKPHHQITRTGHSLRVPYPSAETVGVFCSPNRLDCWNLVNVVDLGKEKLWLQTSCSPEEIFHKNFLDYYWLSGNYIFVSAASIWAITKFSYSSFGLRFRCHLKTIKTCFLQLLFINCFF